MKLRNKRTGEFAIYCDVLELDGIERELEIVFGREEL